MCANHAHLLFSTVNSHPQTRCHLRVLPQLRDLLAQALPHRSCVDCPPNRPARSGQCDNSRKRKEIDKRHQNLCGEIFKAHRCCALSSMAVSSSGHHFSLASLLNGFRAVAVLLDNVAAISGWIVLFGVCREPQCRNRQICWYGHSWPRPEQGLFQPKGD